MYLVTGGGGFLGGYICEQLLARGDRVRVYGRSRYPWLEALGAECLQADLRNANALSDACRDVHTVVHAAAIAGIGGRWKEFYETNVLPTLSLLAACQAHGVSRFVYSSSPSVTFDAENQQNVDERAPYARRWLCHYARSKAVAEQLVLAANGPTFATCSLRPHLIWGPRDTHLIPRLIERARQGRLIRVGDGENNVDIVYVENAAAAHLLAADRLSPKSPVAGRAFFISQGEPVNCWQWINQILALDGLPGVKRHLSYSAAWQVGLITETIYRLTGLGGDPPMTRFLAAQLALDHYFNISAARRDLGYVPLVTTAEGMRRLSAWLASDRHKRTAAPK